MASITRDFCILSAIFAKSLNKMVLKNANRSVYICIWFAVLCNVTKSYRNLWCASTRSDSTTESSAFGKLSRCKRGTSKLLRVLRWSVADALYVLACVCAFRRYEWVACHLDAMHATKYIHFHSVCVCIAASSLCARCDTAPHSTQTMPTMTTTLCVYICVYADGE